MCAQPLPLASVIKYQLLTPFMDSSWHHVVGPGFKTRQGKEISSFPKPSRLALESTQPLIHCLPAFFPGVNPLNPELNPICYLLALLAHHFLHVSRIRVKSLTIRLLMSYIYIYIWSAYS